ncbi:hypothetical protein ACFWUQ_09245 [Streptomyces sp. NPDC058662]|uniref:hypothetical protein n=1 Tax=Streptomyces sp. NPDC058662 TaxID=3346583 RepID=UPI0036530240
MDPGRQQTAPTAWAEPLGPGFEGGLPHSIPRRGDGTDVTPTDAGTNLAAHLDAWKSATGS